MKKVYGDYFGGNKISDYGLEKGFVDFSTLAKAFNAVMNNDILNTTSEIGFWELFNGSDYDEDEDKFAEISDNYTDKELEYLRWFIKEWVGSVEISRGCYYGSDYFYRSKIDFAETVIDEMEYNDIRAIREDLIRRFEDDVYGYLSELCGNFAEDGYSFFYDYTDEDIKEWCECNNWEFYDDGRFYV